MTPWLCQHGGIHQVEGAVIIGTRKLVPQPEFVWSDVVISGTHNQNNCFIRDTNICSMPHKAERVAEILVGIDGKASDSYSGVARFEFRQRHWPSLTEVMVKSSRNRTSVTQRVPGTLGSHIFITFDTWRWWGRQPHAPVAFTSRIVPGTHFH